MTDEQQVRTLLTVATEPTEELAPPVQRLLRLGRRRRMRRAAVLAFAIGVVTILGVIAPQIIRMAVSGQQPPAARAPKQWHWSTLPGSPLVTVPAVFTSAGRYALELGSSPTLGQPFGPGAVFDTKTSTWHRMAPVPFNADRVGCTSSALCDQDVPFIPTAVWTGRQLFVTDGVSPLCTFQPPAASGPICVPYAGLYDPATNRWSTTRLPKPMYLLAGYGGDPPNLDLSATWTGREVVLAGITYKGSKLEVAAYNPATARWHMITPALPAGHVPASAAVVATSAGLLLWVQWESSDSSRDGVDVMALSTSGRWRDITDGWPQGNAGDIYGGLLAGSRILVAPRVFCSGPDCSSYRGAFVDPATLHRSTIPFSPLDPDFPEYVWAGDVIIEVNARADQPRDQTVAFYPAERRWRYLQPAPGHSEAVTAPIWTGTELLLLTERGALLALHP
jgi:hypothetical protein